MPDIPDLLAPVLARLDAIDRRNADLAARVEGLASTGATTYRLAVEARDMAAIGTGPSDVLMPPPDPRDAEIAALAEKLCAAEATIERLEANAGPLRQTADILSADLNAAIVRADQAESSLAASLAERARLTDALANVERERAQAEESEQKMGERVDAAIARAEQADQRTAALATLLAALGFVPTAPITDLRHAVADDIAERRDENDQRLAALQRAEQAEAALVVANDANGGDITELREIIADAAAARRNLEARARKAEQERDEARDLYRRIDDALRGVVVTVEPTGQPCVDRITTLRTALHAAEERARASGPVAAVVEALIEAAYRVAPAAGSNVSPSLDVALHELVLAADACRRGLSDKRAAGALVVSDAAVNAFHRYARPLGMAREDIRRGIEAALASLASAAPTPAPVGEPVAWAIEKDGRLIFADVSEAGVRSACDSRPTERAIVPLYRSPAPVGRVLTVEALTDALESASKECGDVLTSRAMAPAVLRHLGPVVLTGAVPARTVTIDEIVYEALPGCEYVEERLAVCNALARRAGMVIADDAPDLDDLDNLERELAMLEEINPAVAAAAADLEAVKQLIVSDHAGQLFYTAMTRDEVDAISRADMTRVLRIGWCVSHAWAKRHAEALNSGADPDDIDWIKRKPGLAYAVVEWAAQPHVGATLVAGGEAGE